MPSAHFFELRALSIELVKSSVFGVDGGKRGSGREGKSSENGNICMVLHLF